MDRTARSRPVPPRQKIGKPGMTANLTKLDSNGGLRVGASRDRSTERTGNRGDGGLGEHLGIEGGQIVGLLLTGPDRGRSGPFGQLRQH